MAGVASSARVLSAVQIARMQARARHTDSRQKLAGYRTRSDKGLTREEIWEQSGHELRWLREHAAAHSSGAEEEQVVKMVDRIVDEDEPLAYVLGWQPFGPLEIVCRKPVLIPRPETEFLTEHTAALIMQAHTSEMGNEKGQRRLRVLDLCTGSGCIALLLQHRLLQARIAADILAVDKSQHALQLARLNLQRSSSGNNDNGNTRVTIRQLDVFDDQAVSRLVSDGTAPFDVIISNPPYIPTDEWKALDNSVRGWEAAEALVGDVTNTQDGLAFYRRIALLAAKGGLLPREHTERHASSLPSLVVEVGHDQANRVQDIFAATGAFARTATWTDPWHVQRGVLAWRA